MNRITTLDAQDQYVVKTWLEVYLKQHCAKWFDAYNFEVSSQAIDDHLSQHELVSTHWHELWTCAQGPPASGCVFVVRDDAQQLMGIVHLEREDDHFVKLPIGVVSWIYVDPGQRGQGVAKLLINEAQSWFDTQGCLGAEVFVSAWNEHAVSLYEAAGFVQRDIRMLRAPVAT